MSDLRIFETDIQRGSPENLAFSNIWNRHSERFSWKFSLLRYL